MLPVLEKYLCYCTVGIGSLKNQAQGDVDQELHKAWKQKQILKWTWELLSETVL